MTKHEAKAICLEIWGYIKDNPETCKEKIDLPYKLHVKIKGMYASCPLCEIFVNEDDCGECPLKAKNYKGDYTCLDFWNWTTTNSADEREFYASNIYNKVSLWSF